ncbi:MAG: NnrU family protein [Bauldia sp.]|nr:NnrU family protein [Bauldia sp.]
MAAQPVGFRLASRFRGLRGALRAAAPQGETARLTHGLGRIRAGTRRAPPVACSVCPPASAVSGGRTGGSPWIHARYSLSSLAVLVWLVGAARRAPHVPLWHWAPWRDYVPLASMLPVCLILALAIARPNPFSFGGARNDSFDPDRRNDCVSVRDAFARSSEPRADRPHGAAASARRPYPSLARTLTPSTTWSLGWRTMPSPAARPSVTSAIASLR